MIDCNFDLFLVYIVHLAGGSGFLLHYPGRRQHHLLLLIKLRLVGFVVITSTQESPS